MPQGSLFFGLRAANGQWLSLVGGRTHHGITHIEWQMNRADMPAYSLSTAMRYHLLEHEVARGTNRIFFIGGTSHSMRSALVPFRVVDLVVVRSRLPRWLMRRLSRASAIRTNFVGAMLASDTLEWRSW